MELPFETWPYEEQTRMKHAVLNEYLDKWVKILGANRKRLNYFDCFAGCGAYLDQAGNPSYGSLVIAAQIAKQNSKQVNIIVIDEKKANLENLTKVFKYYRLHDQKVIPIREDYDTVVNKILDDVKNLAPSFFFVDPFGFTIRYETIERIMRVSHSEVHT